MDTMTLVGVVLIGMGVLEMVVFRLLGSSNPNLAKVMPMLMGSAVVSIGVGLVFVVLL